MVPGSLAGRSGCSGWDNIPAELLGRVLEVLSKENSLENISSLRSTCAAWRTATDANVHELQPGAWPTTSLRAGILLSSQFPSIRALNLSNLPLAAAACIWRDLPALPGLQELAISGAMLDVQSHWEVTELQLSGRPVADAAIPPEARLTAADTAAVAASLTNLTWSTCGQRLASGTSLLARTPASSPTSADAAGAWLGGCTALRTLRICGEQQAALAVLMRSPSLPADDARLSSTADHLAVTGNKRSSSSSSSGSSSSFRDSLPSPLRQLKQLKQLRIGGQQVDNRRSASCPLAMLLGGFSDLVELLRSLAPPGHQCPVTKAAAAAVAHFTRASGGKRAKRERQRQLMERVRTEPGWVVLPAPKAAAGLAAGAAVAGGGAAMAVY
ncbi:hypothetical protein OEZ86_003953 [Tetradesmus obliquus]|nr:hypothetical protein OEZ86_003953 [Tetradesmus obliquus]